MRILTFHVGAEMCAIDATCVIEILRPQPITPVPRAPAGIAGLLNVRGQIVTAVDLRQRLAQPASGTPMHVLTGTGEETVSFLVDRIGDVLDVDSAALAPPPRTLSRELRALVTSSLAFPERLVLVLDAARAIHHEDDGAS